MEEIFTRVDEVESGFEVMDCLEDRKIKVVTNKLKRSALAYWKHLKNQRALKGKGPINNWEKMNGKFMTKFLPLDYEQRLYMHTQNCKKGNQSVEE